MIENHSERTEKYEKTSEFMFDSDYVALNHILRRIGRNNCFGRKGNNHRYDKNFRDHGHDANNGNRFAELYGNTDRSLFHFS